MPDGSRRKRPSLAGMAAATDASQSSIRMLSASSMFAPNSSMADFLQECTLLIMNKKKKVRSHRLLSSGTTATIISFGDVDIDHGGQAEKLDASAAVAGPVSEAAKPTIPMIYATAASASASTSTLTSTSQPLPPCFVRASTLRARMQRRRHKKRTWQQQQQQEARANGDLFQRQQSPENDNSSASSSYLTTTMLNTGEYCIPLLTTNRPAQNQNDLHEKSDMMDADSSPADQPKNGKVASTSQQSHSNGTHLPLQDVEIARNVGKMDVRDNANNGGGSDAHPKNGNGERQHCLPVQGFVEFAQNGGRIDVRVVNDGGNNDDNDHRADQRMSEDRGHDALSALPGAIASVVETMPSKQTALRCVAVVGDPGTQCQVDAQQPESQHCSKHKSLDVSFAQIQSQSCTGESNDVELNSSTQPLSEGSPLGEAQNDDDQSSHGADENERNRALLEEIQNGNDQSSHGVDGHNDDIPRNDNRSDRDTCQAITKNGRQCHGPSSPGLCYCRIHASYVKTCQAYNKNRKKCHYQSINDTLYCKRHADYDENGGNCDNDADASLSFERHHKKYKRWRCGATTQNGTQCQFQANLPSNYCTVHSYLSEPSEGDDEDNNDKNEAINDDDDGDSYMSSPPEKVDRKNLPLRDLKKIRQVLLNIGAIHATTPIRHGRPCRCQATTSQGKACRQLVFDGSAEYCRSHHIMHQREIIERTLGKSCEEEEEESVVESDSDPDVNGQDVVKDDNGDDDDDDHSNIEVSSDLHEMDKIFRKKPGQVRCQSVTIRKTRCMYIAQRHKMCFRHWRLRHQERLHQDASTSEERASTIAAKSKKHLSSGSSSKPRMINNLYIIPANAIEVRYENEPDKKRCKYTHGLGRCRLITCPFKTGYCYKHTRLTGLGVIEYESGSDSVEGEGEVEEEDKDKEEIDSNQSMNEGDNVSDTPQSKNDHSIIYASDEDALDSSDDDQEMSVTSTVSAVDDESDNDGDSFASNEDVVDSDTCSDQNPDGSLITLSEMQMLDHLKFDRPYKTKEFYQLWKNCEDFCGVRTDEIESLRRVRGANNTIPREDTDGQLKAQYGRLLPRAVKKLIRDIFRLKQNDVFLDIGHGIGNACLQVAFTVGCEARGIEVISGRHSIAQVFRDNLISQARDHNEMADAAMTSRRIIGPVYMKHGRLEDAEHTEFLTKGVTAACVNNFNGVFAERSSKSNQKWFLDDYVAGLFARMDPGAVLVSLHPLNLGPTRTEANAIRVRQGLEETPNASFFEMDQLLLGKACAMVKWCQRSGNRKDVHVYKYTRVRQPGSEDDNAVFVCCNPRCEIATTKVLIPATIANDEGRYVMNHCECKITTKNLRRRKEKTDVARK